MSPMALRDSPTSGNRTSNSTCHPASFSSLAPPDAILTNKSTVIFPSTSKSTTLNQPLSLLCIGIGPATLSIAIALHDTYRSLPMPRSAPPDILLLERNHSFSWHAGMQLPGAKMQISFLKDLATPRDPTSRFTFLNYLKAKGRLEAFINLGTFLPTREEYEDYLRWCVGFFENLGVVRYGVEVGEMGVRVGERGSDGRIVGFEVLGRAVSSGLEVRLRASRVVVAVGGRARIPKPLLGLTHVLHSSAFATTIPGIEEGERHGERKSWWNGASTPKLKLVVVGGGQSAAEIFNDLWERFPHAEIRLILKARCLRPSDDSPFVNEIFSPNLVSQIYSLPSSVRHASMSQDRVTNYGVVRLSLLEHIYEKLYIQRLRHPEEDGMCRILGRREVVSARQEGPIVILRLKRVAGLRVDGQDMREGYEVDGQDRDGKAGEGEEEEEEEIKADYVFAATGYERDIHEGILKGLREFLVSPSSLEPRRKDTFTNGCTNGHGAQQEEDHRDTLALKMPVGRDYRVLYDESKIDSAQAGIWLQGCCEDTHGLSDTLLSILAVRGGEMVESMFGSELTSLRGCARE